jgi:superfamily II DNA or RNA helicase
VTVATLETPTKLRLPDDVAARVRDDLTYEDKSVTYEWLKWHKIQKQDNEWLLNNSPNKGNRHWYFNKNTRESLDSKVAELQKNRFKSLLFKDNRGYWTYSGFVTKIFGKDAVIKREYELPEWGLIPWATSPEHKPRWYQSKSVDLLAPEDLSRSLGAVSLATGAGKSYVLALLIKRLALPTVVITPNLSIAGQLLASFTKLFGKGKVGQYFKGKHQADKFIVVAVAASLARVKEGSEEWKLLSTKKVVLGDECHLSPPAQLKGVIFGLLANIPYRYWVSGTVFRNDGLELTLDGIVGDLVLEVSVDQCVKEGNLSPLRFYQYRIESNNKKQESDPIESTRVHLHRNPNVYKHAAKLINAAVKKGRRVLVQIDSLDQFQYLLKGGLAVESRFAHSGVTPINRDSVPKEYWKSDPNKLVLEFDAGVFPVLVATSVLGTGSDIKSCSLIVNLIGLSSEIEISQNAGRGTRLFPGKSDCVFIDYDVFNVEILHKHSLKRRKIYDSIYGKCEILEAK